MRLTIILQLILITLCVHSQSKIKVKILDEINNPICYASAQISNTSIGTISNNEGILELTIQEKFSTHKLQISCIGYRTRYMPIDSILSLQSRYLTIKLKKQIFHLSEVTVQKQNILKDPKQIFANAIDSLPNLLDPNPNIGEYYFRQTHRDASSMNRIIEAAISIYDPGIIHNIKSCKINIDELQSSLDNRIIDYKTLLILYRYILKKEKLNPIIKSSDSYKNPIIQKKLINFFDEREALLSSFFIKTNMIRGIQYTKRKKSLRINPYFKDGRPIITNSFMKEHRFKLDTILLYNEDPIYKIKILPNKRYPQIRYQKNGIIPIGTAYIRIKDFALFSLDYGYINNPNHKYYNGKSSFYYIFKIQFKDFNNKLYLNYLYSMQSDYNHKYYTKEKKGRQRLIQELMNTEIINNQDSINKKLNTLQWKGNQYKKLPYRKKFWGNYSTMIPTHEEQLLKDNLIEEIKKKK